MPRKRKSTDVDGSPLVERARHLIVTAATKAADEHAKQSDSGNPRLADIAGGYAHGLSDGLTLLELAAAELARKPQP